MPNTSSIQMVQISNGVRDLGKSPDFGDKNVRNPDTALSGIQITVGVQHLNPLMFWFQIVLILNVPGHSYGPNHLISEQIKYRPSAIGFFSLYDKYFQIKSPKEGHAWELLSCFTPVLFTPSNIKDIRLKMIMHMPVRFRSWLSELTTK